MEKPKLNDSPGTPNGETDPAKQIENLLIQTTEVETLAHPTSSIDWISLSFSVDLLSSVCVCVCMCVCFPY